MSSNRPTIKTGSAVRLRAIALSLILLLSPAAALAVPCSLCGDVNGDGKVDITDAMLIAQLTVGLRTSLDCPVQADVNGSGSTDIVDALFIAQLTVEARTSLSCQRPPGCPPGQTEPCYEGSPATLGVGLCAAGTRTCQADRTFGACEAQVLPAPEVCSDEIDQDCNGADEICEQLTLTITSPVAGAVVPASPVVVRGKVSDPAARVSVQNVLAELTGLTFEARVPLFEGANELVARTRNARGVEATARRTVVLDTVPPSLTVSSPAERAILTEAAVPILGTVSDATAVTCLVDGAPAEVGGEGALSGVAALEPGANIVAVTCEDAAGNAASRTLTLFRDAVPLTVVGIDPAVGASGVSPTTSVTVSFSEPVNPDTVGAATFFTRTGSAIRTADVSVATGGLAAMLTPAEPLPAGTRVDVAVTTGITDALGIPMQGGFASGFTTAGEPGGSAVIVGEVYDDTRSLPLAGVTIEAFAAGGHEVLASAATDDRGRYLLAPSQAASLIRTTRAGFTAAERAVASAQGAFADVLDARLTPLAAAQNVVATFGASLTDPAGDVLVIPPGALAADGAVALTPISEQGPRGLLPPGWTPLGIVQVDTPALFDPPATLEIADRSGAAAGKSAVLARYDDTLGAWLAIGEAVVPDGSPASLAGVAGGGQFALVLADTGDGAPLPSVLGAPLPAGVPMAIPDDVDAAGEVRPAVGRADDPRAASATIGIFSSTALRSGTPLRGDFMELFLLRNGGRVAPLGTSQDLIAYRSPTDAEGRTLSATFAIAPSRTFGLAHLTEGTIGVSLFRGAVASRSLIGPKGGGVQTGDGSRVVAAPGALPQDVPVGLQRLDGTTFPVPAPPGLTLIGGLDLDLAGIVATSPLALTLGGAAGQVPTGSQVLVAEARTILGRERLVLVAFATIDGDAITTVTTVDGVSLPGVRAGGRYGFFRFDGPLALVAGTAREEAGRRDGHMLEILALSLVSVTDASGHFVLVSPPGVFTLLATGATNRDQVRVTGATGTPLAEIVIGATPPHVESILVRLPRLAGDFAGPVVLAGTPAPVIDDDATGASHGDGDSAIEPGERIELTLSARNDGTVPFTGGFFALQIRRPGAQLDVTPATITVGALPPDVPISVGPFSFEVPLDVDPATLRYTLAFLTDRGLSNQSPFELPLGVDHPNVPVGSEITVRFSEAVVLHGGLALARESDLAPVAANVLPSEDGTSAVLRPLEPLAGDTVYRLALDAVVVDTDGRALAGAPVVERFRTQDVTPPPPIDPGRIEASTPAADGFITVRGSPGSVNPDDIVIVLNEETGLTVLADVGADGSFVARIRATVTDQLTIIVRDRTGNETTIDPGPLVRRDPVTGEIVSVVVGRAGGTVNGPDPGLLLVVPPDALAVPTELALSRVDEPFALPPDIAADAALAAAFGRGFTPVARVRIDADTSRFGSPLRLVLPPPSGAAAGDLFLVVRSRSVQLGGPLVDLDQVTGIALAENPFRTVERLEIVDSATVKEAAGGLVLSTDSPPFSGILEPGLLTVLAVEQPLTFFAGEVRRDVATGRPITGAVVQAIPSVNPTAPFVAVTDRHGRFVVADATAGGPYPIGKVIAGRLQASDPDFGRVIRRDVRGVVGAPAPPGTTIVYLSAPVLLPSTLPSAFVDLLGDIEAPRVSLRVTGPSYKNGLTRVGDPLTVSVSATDNDLVEFIGLAIDQGGGFEEQPLGAEGELTFTPATEAVIVIRGRARDRSGNVGTVEQIIRSVAAPGGGPIIPGPIAGPPVVVSSPDDTVSFDGGLGVPFSEPIDPASVTDESVHLLDPEGQPVDISVTLGAGDTLVRVAPKRLLRFGACYTLEIGGVRDRTGESFAGKTVAFTTPLPEQVANIALPNTKDVALAGDVLVAINHPDRGQGEGGTLHTYRVRDQMAPSRLLSEPEEIGSIGLLGRPLSVAVDGVLAFVANRSALPVLAAFDLTDLTNPSFAGAKVINFGGSDDKWDRSAFPRCVEVTSQGVAVLNWGANVELFTNAAPPQSRGVIGRIQGMGESLGRCGGTEFGQLCGANPPFPRDGLKPECPGSRCVAADEFFEAAFLDNFVVTFEPNGVRSLSMNARGVLAGEPTVAFHELRNTPYGRVGAVPRFTDLKGSPFNLAFVSGSNGVLTILAVTNEGGFEVLSEIRPPKSSNVSFYGNMSFDPCLGIAYLHGFHGGFHVIDFNDPTAPRDLNDPGEGKAPFKIEEGGARLDSNGNSNGDGVVYVTTDAGVAVVNVRACDTLGGGCGERPATGSGGVIPGSCDTGRFQFSDHESGHLIHTVATDGAAVVEVKLVLDPRTRSKLGPDESLFIEAFEVGRSDDCPLGGLFTEMPGSSDGPDDPSVIVKAKDGAATVFYRAPDHYLCDKRDLHGVRRIEFRSALLDRSVRQCARGTLQLVRPPVLLVHGFNAKADMWRGFPLISQTPKQAGAILGRVDELNDLVYGASNLQNNRETVNIPSYRFYAADYSSTNDDAIYSNATTVAHQARGMLDDLLADGIAVRRFDAVAHSMGAPIVRHVDDLLNKDQTGSRIRRFISLDGVHRGSMLADCMYANRDEHFVFFANPLTLKTCDVTLKDIAAGLQDAAPGLAAAARDFIADKLQEQALKAAPANPPAALVLEGLSILARQLPAEKAVEGLAGMLPVFHLERGAVADLRTGAGPWPLMGESYVHTIVGALDQDPVAQVVLEGFFVAFKGLLLVFGNQLAADGCQLDPPVFRLPVPIVPPFFGPWSLATTFGADRPYDIAVGADSQQAGLRRHACSIFGGELATDEPCSASPRASLCTPECLEKEAIATFLGKNLHLNRNFGVKHLVGDFMPGRGVAESSAVALKIVALLELPDPASDLEQAPLSLGFRGGFEKGFPFSADSVPEQIGCQGLPYVNLTIFDGQDGAPVSESEEETVGALTVANLNDTDGDGVRDGIDDAVTGTSTGRDEVDLMKLAIDPPIPDQGGSMRVHLRQGFARFWKERTKKEELAPSQDGTLEFSTSSLPRTIWVEAPTVSNEIGDIVIEAEYQGARDVVRATGVWAEVRDPSVDVLHERRQSAWEDFTEPPMNNFLTYHRGASEQTAGFGLIPIPSVPIPSAPNGPINPIGEAINSIGIRFTVRPPGIGQISRVRFDLTRQLESKTWVNGPQPVEAWGFPASDEEPNDDNPATIDESVSPSQFDHIFVVDIPGRPDVTANLRAIEVRRDNFRDWARVSFNFQRPQGLVAGSRCSDKFPWHNRYRLVDRAGVMQRTTGDAVETDENDIGPGHIIIGDLP